MPPRDDRFPLGTRIALFAGTGLLGFGLDLAAYALLISPWLG